jgi:D-xylose transport system substrate-binding protein
MRKPYAEMERNMSNKIISLMLATLFLIMSFAGCSNNNQKESADMEKDDSLQIGLSFDSFVIERWVRDRDAFVMTAHELGAEVNVQVANGDVDTQISQIKYFIKKKMDVIVIVAADGNALKGVVKEAKDAGIKIVCYDRLIKNADTDLYISFDNEAVGRDMAQALVDAVPNGGEIRNWYLNKISDLTKHMANRKKNQSESMVAKALNYLNNNFTKDISLDEVSREVNINPYYFSKRFKEETGVNFIDYLTGIRINKAKELLENPNLSIKEICTMSGYSDPNYFSRIFKKIENVTPSEYREKSTK